MNFKFEKRSIFVTDSYLKDNVFTAVKRDVKGYLFREKWYIKCKGVGPGD